MTCDSKINLYEYKQINCTVDQGLLYKSLCRYNLLCGIISIRLYYIDEVLKEYEFHNFKVEIRMYIFFYFFPFFR
jgi:hypothetical protein